jgi:hypothetical protein
LAKKLAQKKGACPLFFLFADDAFIMDNKEKKEKMKRR